MQSGLEKFTNANRSVSTVNDQLFPVELTEIASWMSMSEYMLHSNFGQTLTRVIGGNFGAYTFILPLSLFPKYCLPFFKVLSTESWLVGCFRLDDPLRQYFSLYWTSPRDREKGKRKDRREKKCPNNPHPDLLQAQKALALLLSKLVGALAL